MVGGAGDDVIAVDVIPLPAGGVVFKRGIHEVVLRGDVVGTIVGPLSDLLRDPAAGDAVLAALPDDERALVEHALAELRSRGIAPDPAPPPQDGAEQVSAPTPAQRAFYSDFGPNGAATPERLGRARLVFVGDTAIARTTLIALVEMGCADLAIAADPALSTRNGGRPAALADVEVLDPGSLDLTGADLVCATSDVGEVDALLDVNRAAIAAGVPFLAAWLSNLQGYVGPLVHPHETACLRCYRLRADSHDDRYETARVVRSHISATAADRVPAALPPMTAVLGQLLGMEIAKAIGGFAPSDVVGRSVQVNLVSLRMTTSRVLKVPRCPDCADTMRRSPEVIIVGPQITE